MVKPSQRSIVCTESGSVLEKPTRVKFGVLKVLLVVLPSIYVGGIMSRTGAHLLEEHDIFVPENDDDDD
ncbi:hypothetical protein HELRODRAFT_96981 [Helobdella robusta]|uniref:Essential MCU regulator, mitochondrial n=1 Tax=Helobdella robusta TaxID=6412 RepID=T1G9E8_HELRO|nr:hypothetical protein HELRODRAFT_96981 [Helobdella robusta]ESO10730.1 hypothetical protein HELRODRAFT_96981 [Helobdella robusta]